MGEGSAVARMSNGLTGNTPKEEEGAWRCASGPRGIGGRCPVHRGAESSALPGCSEKLLMRERCNEKRAKTGKMVPKSGTDEMVSRDA